MVYDGFSISAVQRLSRMSKFLPFYLVCMLKWMPLSVCLNDNATSWEPSLLLQHIAQNVTLTAPPSLSLFESTIGEKAYADVIECSKGGANMSATIRSFKRFNASPENTSATQLLEMIAGGSRSLDDGSFVLAGNHSLRWPKNIDFCRSLQRNFGQVIFIGDSIIRQMFFVLMSLLRDSLSFGSLKDWVFTARNESMAQCQCGKLLHCGYKEYEHEPAVKRETRYGPAHYMRDSYQLRTSRHPQYNLTTMPLCPSLSGRAPAVDAVHLWRPYHWELDNDDELRTLLLNAPKSLVVFSGGLWWDHDLHLASKLFENVAKIHAEHPSTTILCHGSHWAPEPKTEIYRTFNGLMRNLSANASFAFFDVYNLTYQPHCGQLSDGTKAGSFFGDCTHFSYEVVLLKAVALLSWVVATSRLH